MTRGAPSLFLACVLSVGGCVYFNSLYNAQRLFDEAERERWAGREAEAQARYDSVVSKAARSFRKEPDGKWADDALYLLGKAYLRRGAWADAEAALERAASLTDDRELRTGVVLYQGVVAAMTGDRFRGLGLLNEALRGVESDELRAEAHLWRGRLLLAGGQVDEGWWDLDRAGEARPGVGVAADLDRVLWGILRDEPSRAERGVDRLLDRAEAHARGDTLRSLVEAARRTWGAAPAAGLLDRAQDAAWPRKERDQLVNLRARLRLEAGDTARALADAQRVASGAGEEAVMARRFLALVYLARVREVAELGGVRSILLPAVGDPEVLSLLEAVRVVELLAARAREEEGGVAMFAAGEIARDDLGARALARRLFLRHADQVEDPWVGKALLAALSLTTGEAQRRALDLRLEGLRDDPYVVAARGGGHGDGRLAGLESALAEALDSLLAQVSAQAAQLDVLVRERSDTVS